MEMNSRDKRDLSIIANLYKLEKDRKRKSELFQSMFTIVEPYIDEFMESNMKRELEEASFMMRIPKK